jgi:hypothetical protein
MRGRIAVAGLLLAVACAVPAEARTSIAATFRIPAPEGQLVDVDASDGELSMSVAVGNGEGFAGALYSRRATVKRRRLVGDLGAFGEIDLRFKPRGKPKVTRFHGCRSKVKRGVFAGHAAYSGEADAAAAAAERVRGRVAVSKGCVKQFFKRPRPPEAGRAVVLSAVTKLKRLPVTVFNAMREPGVPGVFFEAQRISRESRVFVLRYAGVATARSAFAYDPGLTRASIAPPPPFTGTAEYERVEKSRGTIAGDLSITLLDGIATSLAGPDFGARLFENVFTEPDRPESSPLAPLGR